MYVWGISLERNIQRMVLANIVLKKSEVSSPKMRGSPQRTAVRFAVMSVPWKTKT